VDVSWSRQVVAGLSTRKHGSSGQSTWNLWRMKWQEDRISSDNFSTFLSLPLHSFITVFTYVATRHQEQHNTWKQEQLKTDFKITPLKYYIPRLSNVNSADKLRLQMLTLKAASNPIHKDAQQIFSVAHKIHLEKK